MSVSPTDSIISENTSVESQNQFNNLSLLRRYFVIFFTIWLFLSGCIFFHHGQIIQGIISFLGPNLTSGFKIISLDVTKPFSLLISASLFSSFIFLMPLLIYFSWKFVTPGLYHHEVTILKYHVIFLLLSIISLQLFSFFIVVPKALNFFLSFNIQYFGDMLDLFSLLQFILLIQKGFLICSLLPIVMSILLRFRFISLYAIERFRRWFYVGAFCVAMLLTPPDVISQCLMAIPLILLFELTIIFLKFLK